MSSAPDAAAPANDASPSVRLAAWRIGAAAYWLALIVGTHLPGLAPINRYSLSVFQFDKIAHGTAFALLTALLLAARPLGRETATYLTRIVVTLVVLIYALGDELSQRWFGRVVDPGDLVANAIGILSVSLIAASPTGLTRWPSWLVNTARAIWLAIVPATVMLAVTPQAIALLHKVSRGGNWNLGSDKQGHFFGAMVLTWLLAVACPGTRGQPRLSTLLTLLAMILSAPLIEIAQRSLGRGHADPNDVYAHMCGLVAALMGWSLLSLVSPWWNRFLDQRPSFRGLSAAKGGMIPPKPEDDTHTTRFVGHAFVVGIFTLASRLTGLVRDAVLAAAFGLGGVADAFFLGFLIPNLFRRLFGEGALAAAFIPHYTDLLKKDPQLARRFASLCVVLLTVLLSGITVAVQAVLLWMLRDGGWDERGVLAIRLTTVMLPYMPMVCVVALMGGLLQVHRKFGPAANAPIVLNLVMIAFAVWAGAGLSADDVQAQQEVAFIVAGSVLVAGLIQLGYLVISVQRVTRLTPHFRGSWPTLRSMMAMMGPMVIGLAVFQINSLMDVLIAMWLSPGQMPVTAPGTDTTPMVNFLGMTVIAPMKLGDIAALQWSQRLYQFPLGVFGIAIATAIFPVLSSAVETDETTGKPLAGERFAEVLRRGLRLTVFIGLPAGVGLVLVRLPLTRVVYERYAFNLQDAQRVAGILGAYAVSIWAYSMTHVLTRAFYALKDTMTPLKISVSMVMLNFALNLTLVWGWGAQGLAISTAATSSIQAVIMVLVLGRRVGTPVDRGVLLGWARTLGVTAVMALALLPVGFYMDVDGQSRGAAAVTLAAMVGGGALVALIAAVLLGCEELRWLRRR